MPYWNQNRFTSKFGIEFPRIRLSVPLILTTLFPGITAYAAAVQHSEAHPVQNAARQEPLEDRVNSAPERVLKLFGKDSTPNRSSHVVTPAERVTLENALAQLTPFQREVLQKRLHAIYFIDGLPGNALTFPDGGSTPKPMYSIAVRRRSA